jgi:hypothetical protein
VRNLADVQPVLDGDRPFSSRFAGIFTDDLHPKHGSGGRTHPSGEPRFFDIAIVVLRAKSDDGRSQKQGQSGYGMQREPASEAGRSGSAAQHLRRSRVEFFRNFQ